MYNVHFVINTYTILHHNWGRESQNTHGYQTPIEQKVSIMTVLRKIKLSTNLFL